MMIREVWLSALLLRVGEGIYDSASGSSFQNSVHDILLDCY